jgi:hypothetical protein
MFQRGCPVAASFFLHLNPAGQSMVDSSRANRKEAMQPTGPRVEFSSTFMQLAEHTHE